MGKALHGTYVLTSDQTSLDGARVTPGSRPKLAQVWRWQGDAIRLDGPQSTLVLTDALGQEEWRRKVAHSVRRRFEIPPTVASLTEPEEPDLPEGFLVSDGEAQFTVVPIPGTGTRPELLWFPEGMPLKDHEYMVIQIAKRPGGTHTADYGKNVICFTHGTRIRTDAGDIPVEELQRGDMIQTRDNGPQELLWIGTRHITGARLYAMPALRPVRIRGDAFGRGMPDTDLLVSPQHRMLETGPRARALFNTDEVLIRAIDMVNDHSVLVDHAVREVIYVHLMFAQHQIIWANNVPTESFFPADTSLDSVLPGQKEALLHLFPDLETDLHSYGPSARRGLSQSDAAILLHGPH